MTIISCRNLTRSFGGVTAVRNVSFDVAEGTITALIGPNGAGKTTIFNLISGLDRPEAGSITVEGTSAVRLPPHRISGSLKLVRTFQNIRVFPQLSALENVQIGAHSRFSSEFLLSILRPPSVRRHEAQSLEIARTCIDFVGISHRAHDLAGTLSYGEQRLVEIARALAVDPRCLLLDEPAAGLNLRESLNLVDLLRRIRDRGITVLFIEHKMDMVMSTADQIIVLNFGEVIASGPPHVVRRDQRVIDAYLGVGGDHS